ncbi:hypothetical protein ACFSUD_09475 [Sulfitobacter aestuarii]|uniref:Uncharacterized protein n=1 Tax=Sulfitobacter aestuarii TaxID=2161676 RepID=A0ABW5U505_9RHOB
MMRKISNQSLSPDPNLSAARAHFSENGPALCSAAEILAGDAGTARVLRLMSDLRQATGLNRGLRRRLVDLHRLLSPDPISGGFDQELSPWTILDPGSPEVEEICLLTDRLYELLKKIDVPQQQHCAWALPLIKQKAA